MITLQARQWLRITGVLLLILAIFGIGLSIQKGLQPCGWLDVRLKRSGCWYSLRVYRSFIPPSVSRVVFSPDGKNLAAIISGEGNLWRLDNNRVVGPFFSSYIRDVAFSPDSAIRAEISHAGIEFRKTESLEKLDTLEWQGTDWNRIAFSPSGATIATGSQAGRVQLWQIPDLSLIQVLAGHTSSISSLVFDRDGAILAAGAFDGTVRVWQLADEQLMYTVPGQGKAMVVISPDGMTLAIAGQQIQLRQLIDGVLLHTLAGEAEFINSIAFSPNGQMLASGDTDSTVRLWRVSDGSLLRTLAPQVRRFGNQVNDLAWKPNEEVLAIGGDNDRLELWRIEGSYWR